jgi:hypothetical protein
MKRNISMILDHPRFEPPILIIVGAICLVAILVLCQSRAPEQWHTQVYLPVSVQPVSDTVTTIQNAAKLNSSEAQSRHHSAQLEASAPPNPARQHSSASG